MMSPELPGLIELGLEVGGVPVRLGDSLDNDEWRKAYKTGGFNPVWFLGKLLLDAGISADKAYAARNQDLLLFGGKVFVAPDLGGGPLKYGMSASAFFRGGSLYRLREGVTGDRKAATHFARQCEHALVRLLGDPSQRTKGGAPVWWGNGDRLTLVHKADACLVHELTIR
jgi:hypothetical protein